MGNRTSSHLSPTHLYDASNRLLEDQSFTYTYDLNGNLLSKTEKGTGRVTTYTYDPENQLIRINFPNAASSRYSYDALGRRIEKDANGAFTRYVYDSEDILLEYNGGNRLTSHFTHGPGIDEPLQMAQDLNSNGTFEPAERFHYHADGLGSVTDLTDTGSNLVQSYVYDSFGNILNQSGSLLQSYTYTAREFDSESGLLYYRARYYDPRMGRFISEDPVGLEEGINLYPYVFNDPWNSTDPLGKFPRFFSKEGWDTLKEGAKQILKAKYGASFTEAEYEEVATDFANEAKVPEAQGLDPGPKGVNKDDPAKRDKIAKGISKRLEKKYRKDPKKRGLLKKQRQLDFGIGEETTCP